MQCREAWSPGVPYAIRFQCQQREGSTLLRAKMWRQDDAEPGDWMVETEDSTPELQNTSGSFANDMYNYAGTGSVWVHDVAIARAVALQRLERHGNLDVTRDRVPGEETVRHSVRAGVGPAARPRP